MRTVTVRKARAEDCETAHAFLDALAAALARDATVFVAGAFEETFAELLDERRGVVLLAEADGEALGMISVSYNLALRYGGAYAQIEELVVAERTRGLRVGSALVDAAIAEARQQGCKEIGLYAIERNRPFYEKLGFVYTGPELRQRLNGTV